MNNYSIFLLSVREARAKDVTVNSTVTAAVVGTSEDGAQFDIKVASDLTIKQLLFKASRISGKVKLGNFNVTKEGNVTGTGLVGISSILATGPAKAIAVAQIKRIGSSDTAGFVMCDREGRAGQMTKKNALMYMQKNGADSVQNLKLCRPGYGKADYIAAQELDTLPVYIIGAKKAEVKAEEPNRTTSTPQNKPQRDEANAARKKAVLAKLAKSKVGQKLNERYDYDAIMFIVYLAKKHRVYSYLLNPEYTEAQMRVLHSGFREGYDISQFNDASISDKEMLDRLNLMRLGVWYEVKTSRLQ